jgi:hypothetical protein
LSSSFNHEGHEVTLSKITPLSLFHSALNLSSES